MAMQVIYTGEFRSVDGVLYRVDILSSNTSFASSQEVKFAYDTPVEIEWNEVDKLEPVQGSCLTLTLQSLKDRQFINLYSIEVGTMRADVYRNGKLYWSGQLDTELYEEPYSEKTDYDVTFSFSDFAVLDRVKWSKTGVCTIQDVIDTCIAAMGIKYNGVQKFISTKTSQYGSAINFSSLYVLNDNFYDEDGEAMTMREVLDEVLRPFALRMVQKGGYLYIFDMNAVYSDMDTEEVWWKGDDAYLGVDVVYNNVKVTFSPYADAKLVNTELEHDNVLPDKEATRKYLMDYDWDNAADGFRIVVGDQDDLPMTLANGAKYYRIDSDFSGNDEAGVIWGYKGNGKTNYSQLLLNSFVKARNNGVCTSVPIISTKPSFLGYVSYKRTSFKLKVTLDLLFDVRYNPFEDASGKNESGNWERLNDWCNVGYVPVMLYLKDASGKILYHYENSGVIDLDGYKHTAANSKWVSGAGKWGCMWLCYYDWDNRKSKTGFGGWSKNKPIIGYYRGGLPKKWKAMGDGEFIDLPPYNGGFLEFHIGRGIYQFDYKREEKDIYSRARWLMYQTPTITLVNSNGTDISLDDIEDTAWINKAAKEELTIDTILGTLGKTWSPSARGLVMDSTYKAYQTFYRAGVEDRLERLLIGTVYSQYGSRHNTLSGTVRLLPDLKIHTDASSSGKYILLSEVQNLLQDSSEITMAELSADNYEGIEFS